MLISVASAALAALMVIVFMHLVFLMTLEHAARPGANAIIGFGSDTTELRQGMTEVLAFGTAVVVEPEAAAG